MRSRLYLVFNRNGVNRLLKQRLTPLKGGEVAVQLTVTIDDQHFRSPLVKAEMGIGEEYLVHPEVEVELEELKEAQR